MEASSFGIRQARDGERFTGLDERELTLDSRAQVVTCHDQPIALAGVMGSLNSRVTGTTRRIWRIRHVQPCRRPYHGSLCGHAHRR